MCVCVCARAGARVGARVTKNFLIGQVDARLLNHVEDCSRYICTVWGAGSDLLH